MTQSPPPGLVEAVQALRTWIESRQFEGYEPFDLLNSPYLAGAWARKALPGIILIQAGKRFAGLRLRRLLKVPPSRNPKALGLCLSAYCDLARSGCDVSAQAIWLKNELIRLRSPHEPEFCWGYDWDYRLPARSAAACLLPKLHRVLLLRNRNARNERGFWRPGGTGRLENRSPTSWLPVCSARSNPKMKFVSATRPTAKRGFTTAAPWLVFFWRASAGCCGNAHLPFPGAQSHGFSGKRPARNRWMVLRATSAATLDRQLPHFLQCLRPARLSANHRGLNL